MTLRPWSEVPPEEQLALRQAYGQALQALPPTCSMETKVARFASFLADRGIAFSAEDLNRGRPAR